MSAETLFGHWLILEPADLWRMTGPTWREMTLALLGLVGDIS